MLSWVSDIQKLLVQFVQSVKERYGDNYQTIKTNMAPEMGARLDHCLTINLDALAPVVNGGHHHHAGHKGNGCC
jgi:hypothetical protein